MVVDGKDGGAPNAGKHTGKKVAFRRTNARTVKNAKMNVESYSFDIFSISCEALRANWFQ